VEKRGTRASTSARRGRAVSAGAVVLTAGALFALTGGLRPAGDGERPRDGADEGRPASRAVDGRGQATRTADGRRHVIDRARPRGGALRFEIARLEHARVVTVWLEQGSKRRWLSVRGVSRASRRGVLRVRLPRRWPARPTMLLVRTASAAGVHGCGYGTFAAGAWPAACWRPYSARSPFNQRLPAAPRVLRGSERLVARMLAFGPARNLIAGQAGTVEDYEHPTYYSQPTDPLFRLHCYEERWGTCSIEGHRIRVPADARPAGGDDGHLTVVDQDTGWEYDLYRVISKPSAGGALVFRWGGRTRIDGDGLRSGATAAKFGNLAGIVRAAELRAGRIDHALFMTVHCDAGRRVFPAHGKGRSCAMLGETTEDALPMGSRLQLAMTAGQIDALVVPQWKKAILRAMARYGMFVGDTGGGTWGIQMESGATFTSFGEPDPLVRLARATGWTPYEGVWVGDLHDDVDWAGYLRVIDPCVTRRRC
jgi:hypothetical protein